MNVNEVTVRQQGENTEVSANSDAGPLWLRFRNAGPLPVRGDAFLALSLLPAMIEGRGLRIDAPVSSQLLRNVDRLQDVFHSWNPAFRKVPISAPEEAPRPARSGVAAFFSGGVDATYSFLKNRDRITDLVCIRGLDFSLDNTSLIESVSEANRELARHYGKRVIEVETNVRKWCYPVTRLALFSQFAGVLGGIGLALGVQGVLHASGTSYLDMPPQCTHPLITPLWSTEVTRFQLDGCEASRSDKLAFVGRDKYALDQLRVCWDNAIYNCGRCDKCLRTRITLRLLGITSSRLAPADDLGELRHLRASDHDIIFWEDNLRLAEKVGDQKIAAFLRRKILRFKLQDALRKVDRELLGGFLSRRLRKKPAQVPESGKVALEAKISY